MAASFNELMETGEDAYKGERYAVALAGFESALNAATAPHQRATALDRMANACYHLKQDSRAFALLDDAIAAALPSADADEASAVALAHSWYDKGGMMAQIGPGQRAFEPLDLLIGRFAERIGDRSPGDRDELRLMVARAMELKAAGLRKLDRTRDAVAYYDDMIRRFEPVTEGRVEALVARAMRNRAWLLGDLGREDEEIAAHDALVARYGRSRLPEVSHIIIDALTSKHQCLRDQEEFEQAAAVCEDIIRRFISDTGDGIAERVARTMIRRGNYLNKLGRTAEELAAYDQVMETYARADDPAVRVHAAKALMFKAVSLGDADQVGPEIACYEEVLRRYAGDPDAEVRAVAADALIHKGMSLGAIAEDAAEDTGVREVDAEIACYDDVVARFDRDAAIHLQRSVAEALLHKAEALLEVDRVGEALPCLDRLLAVYAPIDDEEIADIVKDARALRAEI